MKYRSGRILALVVLAVFLSLQVVGCGSSGSADLGTGGGGTTPPPSGDGTTPTAANGFLSLSLTQTSVKSDNSDKSTITATVLDSKRVPIENIPVDFTASGGQISASKVSTNNKGEAVIEFSSGTVEKMNQTVTIEASVNGLAAKQIPVKVTGTTVELFIVGGNILKIGGTDTSILTIQVRDAGSKPIFSAPVTVSIEPAGKATVVPAEGNYLTDVNGTLKIDVTGTAVGNLNVRVDSLGASAVQSYSVGADAVMFGITAPVADPHSLRTNTPLTITVQAPPPTISVLFATSLGSFGGVAQVVDVLVAGGFASAVLTSPQAGIATVQVFDKNEPAKTDSLRVAISAPSDEAAQIALQAAATNVSPSTGGTQNTITLRATVKNNGGQVVGGAPVSFFIQNPTGGGETLNPVLAFTNDFGVASTTFTSGALSSGAQGVTIQASVVSTLIKDTVNIVIGGTAGSLVIGQSTKIQSNETDTAYTLPMSVLVSDSNGNAVSNAVVSLSSWPSRYSTGGWVEITPGKCAVTRAGYDFPPGSDITFFDNEDLNRNLILDPGEDGPKIPPTPGDGDLELTPPAASAGLVPATVLTDENGVAGFNFTYLKQYSVWIEAEIKASTQVLGTETTSTLKFVLPFQAGEECNLPDSPFNP